MRNIISLKNDFVKLFVTMQFGIGIGIGLFGWCK